LICAAFVLVYLHQRHVRKQRLEDKNDPHKSLDFGMEGVGGKQESKWAKQRKGPEMSVTDVDGSKTRKDRGLSLDDMGLGNPYLLPGELAGSGGSIHSMSRSLHDDHDPYRPVTFIKGDNESIRSRAYNEKASIYSGATSIHSSTERAGLVANASRMSQSFPKRGDSKLSGEPLSPQDSIDSDTSLARTMHSQNNGPSGRKSIQQSEPSLPNISEASPRINVHSPPPPPEKELSSPPPRSSSAAVDQSGPATRKGPLPHIAIPPRMSTQSSDYGDIEVDEIDEAPAQRRVPSLMVEEPNGQNQRLSVQGLNPSAPYNRLSVMGLRPLPPSGVPEDNPETRANRIRSFYKEYFDDSKPEPAGAQYQDTYDLDYLTDAAIYDPDTGGFAMAARPGRATNRPFAEPLGRRAMTPPPRGARTPVPGPHRRRMSTHTLGRQGPPRGPMAPQKKLPPPMPLKSLPTPGMLKDDTAIFNADDFAPPVSYRDRQAGRGMDSPTGSLRPYSPSVASHVPLANSMADLSPMPSPFQMRKSGTFTGLDFAPPSRIRAPGDGMSDAGSIRSARSGISNMHSDALRAGAYRVSRLPPEMVGTRDDLASQLKPSWDMRRDNTMG
jgi:hypothetical protein